MLTNADATECAMALWNQSLRKEIAVGALAADQNVSRGEYSLDNQILLKPSYIMFWWPSSRVADKEEAVDTSKELPKNMITKLPHNQQHNIFCEFNDKIAIFEWYQNH